MELSEDEIIQKYGKKCGHCNRNTLLPYEFAFTCISCGYDLIKLKHELSKIQRKKINCIKRLKVAEHKIFYICIEVFKIYGGNDYNKIDEVLSKLKNKNKQNLNWKI